MNTKYTLEMTIDQTNYNLRNPLIRLMPIVCKSVRYAKTLAEDLQPTVAIIKNKRGEPIHEYTEGEGWKRVNISKRNHCMLITVGYNWKTRKPITVPLNQYNV